MTVNEAINILENNLGIANTECVVEALLDDELSPAMLFEAMKNTTNSKTKFRLAWSLERLAKLDIDKCESFFADILAAIPTLEHDGQTRCLLKIIVIYLDRSAKSKRPVFALNYLDTYYWDDIIGRLFEHLLADETPNGVKVLAAYILARLSVRYCWIADDLKFHMQHRLDSPSMIAANKKIVRIITQNRIKILNTK